jgi:transcription termination factor NusB
LSAAAHAVDRSLEVLDVPLSEAEIEDWRRRMLALERTQQTLIDNQEAILRDLDSKHRQNQDEHRADKDFFQKVVDKLSEKVDKLSDIITNVRIENARWNIGAGVVTAVTIEVVKHVWPGK